MLEIIREWWDDRRKESRRANGHDRRQPTLAQANERLKSAVDEFSTTITLTPERVKELIERVKR